MPRAELECRWCGIGLGPVSMVDHVRDEHTCDHCHQPATMHNRFERNETRMCKPCYLRQMEEHQARRLAQDLGEARKANVRLTDEEMVAELLELRTELADG